MTKAIKITKRELTEIMKRVVNEVFENSSYASKLSDSELEDFTYLSKTDTSLPYEIFVDSGQGYKRNRHPLCLYIVHGQNLIPVTVSSINFSIVDFPQPFGPIKIDTSLVNSTDIS
jgi:hypothetical protein